VDREPQAAQGLFDSTSRGPGSLFFVMSQAQALLKNAPEVQDIPNFESMKTGDASHLIKRRPVGRS